MSKKWVAVDDYKQFKKEQIAFFQLIMLGLLSEGETIYSNLIKKHIDKLEGGRDE